MELSGFSKSPIVYI